MGWEMGRTDRDHARFAERDPCREKAVGRRPTTRWGPKAPDPFSWHIPHQTRHNLGSYFFFFSFFFFFLSSALFSAYTAKSG